MGLFLSADQRDVKAQKKTKRKRDKQSKELLKQQQGEGRGGGALGHARRNTQINKCKSFARSTTV